ncbi:hypothetical protein QTP88_018450 [Uroleucon formosanum]
MFVCKLQNLNLQLYAIDEQYLKKNIRHNRMRKETLRTISKVPGKYRFVYKTRASSNNRNPAPAEVSRENHLAPQDLSSNHIFYFYNIIRLLLILNGYYKKLQTPKDSYGYEYVCMYDYMNSHSLVQTTHIEYGSKYIRRCCTPSNYNENHYVRHGRHVCKENVSLFLFPYIYLFALVFLFAIADLPKPGSKAYNKTRYLYINVRIYYDFQFMPLVYFEFLFIINYILFNFRNSKIKEYNYHLYTNQI